MGQTHEFTVLSFEQLKLRCTHETDFYDPSWDQAKGVIRLACGWSKRLKAERGDLLRVRHRGRSAVYVLKMSPHLGEEALALDYDQQKQLGLLDAGGHAVPISIRKAGRFSTLRYLWSHIDPSIRLPFQISVWLAIFSFAAGAFAGEIFGRTVEGVRTFAAMIGQ